MLLAWAAGWLSQATTAQRVCVWVVGLGVGAFAWRGLFSRLASENASRILRGSTRACLFGFSAPKGWLITAAMVAFGAALRHSSLPKIWLAAPYAAIGVALLLASLSYYPRLATASEGVTP